MAFSAGQPLTANDLNMTALSNADATSRSTTSATFTTTLSPANICGVSFTAPPSGKVLITWNCTLVNSASNYTACAPEIRTGSTIGSGSVFFAASDNNSVSTDTTTFEGQGRTYLVTGLTSGTVYNVALNHRVVGGTGTYLRRDVQVIPQLA